MKSGIGVQKSLFWIAVVLGTTVLAGGCATRKYVRTRVDDSSHGLNARMDTMDTTDASLKGSINATQGQVEELNGVTRDHSQKIASLDDGLKQTDGKAQQALSTGQNAQTSANKAIGQVTTLDGRFQNRNHYVVLSEEKVQ